VAKSVRIKAMDKVEVLPPDRTGLVQMWWWRVQPKTARIIRIGAAVPALGCAAWLLQNFLQLRGVVNLTASRIDLGFLTLCILFVAYVITVGSPQGLKWRVIFFPVIVLLAFAVDQLTPKPPQPTQATTVPKTPTAAEIADEVAKKVPRQRDTQVQLAPEQLSIKDEVSVKRSPQQTNKRITTIETKARQQAELAELMFSFETDDPSKFPMLETTAPLVNGAVSVGIVALATGTIPAKNGWLTILICDECKYAEEPSNMIPMDPIAGGSVIVRQRHFEEIYPGTVSIPIRLKIIPPRAPYDKFFDIGGRYVCDNCPPETPARQQLLRVNIQ
jgi:hypothetical protein